VTRDSATLGTASLGTPLPIDPGEHEISAVAPQHKRWSRKVVAREGQILRIEIPALEPEPVEPAPKGEGTGRKPGSPAPDGASGGGTGGRVIAGAVIGAVGVAGLAVGGVFVGLTASKKSEADSGGCETKNECTGPGYDLIDDAKTFANVANIALAAGGAMVVAGGILILTGLGDDPKPETVSVLPTAGPDGGGVIARLRF
jgi:hypothetical protein